MLYNFNPQGNGGDRIELYPGDDGVLTWNEFYTALVSLQGWMDANKDPWVSVEVFRGGYMIGKMIVN